MRAARETFRLQFGRGGADDAPHVLEILVERLDEGVNELEDAELVLRGWGGARVSERTHAQRVCVAGTPPRGARSRRRGPARTSSSASTPTMKKSDA